MGLRDLYQKVDNKVHVFSRVMGAKEAAKRFYRMRTCQDLPIVRLSDEQKAQVQETWNGQIKSGGFSTHEMVLSATGEFDPYICPACCSISMPTALCLATVPRKSLINFVSNGRQAWN